MAPDLRGRGASERASQAQRTAPGPRERRAPSWPRSPVTMSPAGQEQRIAHGDQTPFSGEHSRMCGRRHARMRACTTRASVLSGRHSRAMGCRQDQRAHSNRKLRFQGFCRSIRAIERVFWSFYSTVRSDRHYRLAFLWPYNLLSDKVLRITVYSCANAHAGPSSVVARALREGMPCGGTVVGHHRLPHIPCWVWSDFPQRAPVHPHRTRRLHIATVTSAPIPYHDLGIQQLGQWPPPRRRPWPAAGPTAACGSP